MHHLPTTTKTTKKFNYPSANNDSTLPTSNQEYLQTLHSEIKQVPNISSHNSTFEKAEKRQSQSQKLAHRKYGTDNWTFEIVFQQDSHFYPSFVFAEKCQSQSQKLAHRKHGTDNWTSRPPRPLHDTASINNCYIITIS
jgi:hypothetical protein